MLKTNKIQKSMSQLLHNLTAYYEKDASFQAEESLPGLAGFQKSSLFDFGGTVVRWLRYLAPNLLNEVRYFRIQQIGPVHLYVVAASFCDNPSAVRRETLKIFLHLIPSLTELDFRLPGRFRWRKGLRILGEDQYWQIAKGTSSHRFVARLPEALMLFTHCC